ncbi:PaaI family thioesterase [Vibrio ostreicida]|uniref:Acyl-coenzyme A thioesterase THEM4 n=1 Tax=Vibrio ostreicida TaxID=526588 RepID=A0ABT8BZB3_9VIBR|nr:hotdog domain-containing protein [Vibrio ostreicida]MDN3612348.1 hotdog domain-containing protein [Vibrio ostreicida]NPD08725.1 PaaI family thioesterase [Vibrio ostreicida]
MNMGKAFQEQIPNNHCFGCGPENPFGLQIKSHWQKENTSIAHFTPSAHHSAGPLHFLNGGIISTIIDCHCVCTAIAKGYQMQDRGIGDGDTIWFATGHLEVRFIKPVPINQEITLLATIEEAKENKIVVSCALYAGDSLCCESDVVAVKVPNQWFEPRATD